MKSDEELMAAYVAGDQAAFEELFRRYAPALLRVIGRQLSSPGEAHDLVQQTFLQLHRARYDFKPGARLRYYSPDKKRVFIVGEVVAVEPPHKFSHTYMFTTSVSPFTLVTWELKEEEGGCRVTITHSGWTTAHTAPEKVAAGWREILGLLKHELETGDLPTKTKIMYAMYGAFMFMMPKSTTTEFVDKQSW